jgi:tryptophan synthase alpha subunit
MKSHERIAAAIRAAKTGGEPALVAYLTAGFPSRDSFKQSL